MHPPSPPPARRERPGARAAAALLLSALVNGIALAALSRAGAFLPREERATAAAVVLARVEASAWEARRRVADTSAAAASQPTPRPSPGEIAAGRVVRVAPSQDPRRPEHARFLAERDNSVARETQWRGTPVRHVPLAARPTAGAEEGQGIPVPGEEGQAETSSPGREGMPAPDAAARIARAQLALAQAPAGISTGPRDAAAPAPADGGLRRTGKLDPRLLPVGEAFGAPGRGAPSGERLPGIPDGDATLVNTRAFRFAAFYQRVAEAIRGEWDPNRVWDAQDPRDQLLGRQTRKVLVDIVLDREGRLRETRLVRGTGLDFFDRECLRAIAAAAPFPNPPRALVGPDGLVVLRDWNLLFEWGPQTVLDRLLPGR